MTRETLYLYTTDEEDNIIPFPPEDTQAKLANYSVNKHRMGDIPTITGTITHDFCLDSLWKRKE